jgi:hypothetical protein
MNIVQIIRENPFFGPIYKRMIQGVEVVPYYFYKEGLHEDQKLDLRLNFIFSKSLPRFMRSKVNWGLNK